MIKRLICESIKNTEILYKEVEKLRMIAEYFMKNYGDLTELSEGLLNDALESIIQQEARENEDARKILGRL